MRRLILFWLGCGAVFIGYHIWICVKPYEDDPAIKRLEGWGMGVGRWGVASPLLPYVWQANAQNVTAFGHIDEEKMDVLILLKECIHVVFSGCTFEDRGLPARVAEMPSLEHLFFVHGTLTDEDACAMLAKLAERQSKVWFLSIEDNPITDQCIEGIASLPQLRAVNLSETRISPEGLKKLHILKPNLHIYESPTATSMNSRPPTPS